MDSSHGARERGFTLVELMIVVAIIGVLAALAIYGISRYLSSSKTSEARQSVGAIARAADIAFKAAKQKAAVLPGGGQGDPTFNGLCGSADPVPATVPAKVAYQPVTTGGDFDTGDDLNGWRCLKFQHEKPIIYQYRYHKGGGYEGAKHGATVPGAEGMEAAAVGDVDGDGQLSYFGLIGEIRNAELVMADHLSVIGEFE